MMSQIALTAELTDCCVASFLPLLFVPLGSGSPERLFRAMLVSSSFNKTVNATTGPGHPLAGRDGAMIDKLTRDPRAPPFLRRPARLAPGRATKEKGQRSADYATSSPIILPPTRGQWGCQRTSSSNSRSSSSCGSSTATQAQ